jgi:hypothetical protein
VAARKIGNLMPIDTGKQKDLIRSFDENMETINFLDKQTAPKKRLRVKYDPKIKYKYAVANVQKELLRALTD